MNTLHQRQELYDSMKNVIDLPTRRMLYTEFVKKYYPEAFEAFERTHILTVSSSSGSVWPDFDGE